MLFISAENCLLCVELPMTQYCSGYFRNGRAKQIDAYLSDHVYCRPLIGENNLRGGNVTVVHAHSGGYVQLPNGRRVIINYAPVKTKKKKKHEASSK